MHAEAAAQLRLFSRMMASCSLAAASSTVGLVTGPSSLLSETMPDGFILASAPLAAASSAVGLVTGPSSLPSETMPDGFMFASARATDLDFDARAELAPESVAPVDPDSQAAQAPRAAFDVWNSADLDLVVRELTDWGTAEDGFAFVANAEAIAVDLGLEPVDAGPEGAVAFAGPSDDVWRSIVTWQHGPYGVVITQSWVFDSASDVIDDIATEQARMITEATGDRRLDRTPGERSRRCEHIGRRWWRHPDRHRAVLGRADRWCGLPVREDPEPSPRSDPGTC